MYLKANIQYQHINDRGKYVLIKETFLTECVSWTDAETTLFKELADARKGFTIKRLDPFKVKDIFIDDSLEDLYHCKVEFTTENSKGKEKKFTDDMLVNAISVPDATERIHKELRQMLIPYEVKDVKKSAILDVFFLPSNN